METRVDSGCYESFFRGKVRDVYVLRDGRIVLISTDRLSAYDIVMLTGVPGKGKYLNRISEFWFSHANVGPHHMIGTDLGTLPEGFQQPEFAGRTMICKRSEVLPVEAVVRGYITGSGWKEYLKRGSVCGITLPKGLQECQMLPEPIFTPTSKAQTGHDEPMTYEQVCSLIGVQWATEMRRRSLETYKLAHRFALSRGIIIADTKFEWGKKNGELLLIDEALTPDSSRFWPSDQYEPGRPQPSFDKQFVRDYLDNQRRNGHWNGEDPVSLPDHIVEGTVTRYREARERICGNS